MGLTHRGRRGDGLGCRRSVAERTVWPEVVVLLPPPLRENLRLGQRVEEFPVEEFVPKLAVEGLDVPVLPGTAGFDEEGRNPDARQPLPHGGRRQLRTVVRAEIGRRARATKSAVSCWRTSSEVRRRATRMARHSRVYSSTTVSIRSARPSCVRSWTKS